MQLAVLPALKNSFLSGSSHIGWLMRLLSLGSQAQQMCDMPLPRGHENDGSPLMAKAAVQGMVDARALHLCQQWNFVVGGIHFSARLEHFVMRGRARPGSKPQDVRGRF